MAEDKEGGVASYEQLQEALFGPGANSGGGLPPGTDRDDVSACARASRAKRVAHFSLSLSLVGSGRARLTLCVLCPCTRSSTPTLASSPGGCVACGWVY